MATERQIAANRRNAAHSSGPRTLQGKLRSRRNAVRHGLTAETVVTSLEDADEFEAFEAALIADYAPQSTIEFQLVGRLASLLWRLRRATLIETGLFEIQGRAVRQQRERASSNDNADKSARLYRIFPTPEAMHSEDVTSEGEVMEAPLLPSVCGPDTSALKQAAMYLRVCRYNEAAAERLGRYETALWRQLAQALVILDMVRRG